MNDIEKANSLGVPLAIRAEDVPHAIPLPNTPVAKPVTAPVETTTSATPSTPEKSFWAKLVTPANIQYWTQCAMNGLFIGLLMSKRNND